MNWPLARGLYGVCFVPFARFTAFLSTAQICWQRFDFSMPFSNSSLGGQSVLAVRSLLLPAHSCELLLIYTSDSARLLMSITSMITALDLQQAVLVFCAIEHIGFCLLETCLWRGAARGVFGTKTKDLNATAKTAANQGVYNLFLAMGALLSLYLDNTEGQIMFATAMFLASCFGATSVTMAILVVQGLPALAAAMLATGTLDPLQQLNWQKGILGVGVGMLVWGKQWKMSDDAATKTLKKQLEQKE